MGAIDDDNQLLFPLEHARVLGTPFPGALIAINVYGQSNVFLAGKGWILNWRYRQIEFSNEKHRGERFYVVRTDGKTIFTPYAGKKF